ncbi:NAD(+) synthase [Hominifimenecus sp. rT4P-3]|uniref:NAD(+) synthase n=1 Tax=Hominifimenecus sp. rT4P-3 TaxID=3242979 RepID=UPI003DA6A8D2
MQNGFIKTAAIAPEIRVADPVFNREQMVEQMTKAAAKGAKLIVFPELCLSGYTCGDLFLQEKLLTEGEEQLRILVDASRDVDALVFAGTTWQENGKLYNVMAAFCHGELLGVIPKIHLPNYGEFYEHRHFTPGNRQVVDVEFVDLDGNSSWIPFGTDILFQCETMKSLVVGAEVCEDLWAPQPPSIRHALAGATVVVNGSASNEVVGKSAYRRNLVVGQSARLFCGYVYATSGPGESTTDVVFSGQNLIAENGTLVAEAKRFRNGITYGVLDVEKLVAERRRNTSFGPMENEGYELVEFSLDVEETVLGKVSPSPFVPADGKEQTERLEEILSIQSTGLRKRLEHTRCRYAVIGISGGLDSTLALLVTARAFDSLGLPREGISAVTMPCFGTTDRTYQNACVMSKAVGATLREIPIRESVRSHFKDIGQEESVHDVTYENAQARERTQVLMDVANQLGGLVVGTGDLSELALGWATYNGDHMSMYGVNGGVPKTLVRHLVRYSAETCGDSALQKALLDVLDTPVSPELLPPEEGKISQKTEDLVGPYELHDFFLYYVLRYGFSPEKIYRLAKAAFMGVYEDAVILHWMKNFYRRFFSQQFKRSCLPDGPKVGAVALSPRGDWRMPSDACSRIWLDEVEAL